MRSISATLLAAVQGRATMPRVLVSLALTPTVRYHNGTANLTWSSQTWVPKNLELSRYQTGPRGEMEAAIEFQGVDRVFTAAFLAEGVQGSGVNIYATNWLSSFAAGDVEQVLASEIDDIRVDADSVRLDLRRQPRLAPNTYVDADAGFTFVDPPGTYHFPGGVVTVRRNDGNF